MTNNKPLGEWTLNEVMAECLKRDDCEGCRFCGGKEGGLCNLDVVPEYWALSETPRFTLEEEAALRVLKEAGIEKVWRGANIPNILRADHKTGEGYILPTKMFPSIQPGQEVNL